MQVTCFLVIILSLPRYICMPPPRVTAIERDMSLYVYLAVTAGVVMMNEMTLVTVGVIMTDEVSL